VAAACSEHGLKLLQCCSSAHSLLDAAQCVQLAIAEWTPAQAADADAASPDAAALDVQATSDQATATAAAGNSSRLGRSGSSAVGLLSPGKGSGAAGSPRALGGRVLSEWDVTCERVLGQKLDLWQVRIACCLSPTVLQQQGGVRHTSCALLVPPPHSDVAHCHLQEAAFQPGWPMRFPA
jgi:hypothetical protein